MSLFAETAHPLLIAFSVVTNGKKIMQVSNASGQILCFNGLKVISLFWVIVGHRFSIQNARGVINYDDVAPVSNHNMTKFKLNHFYKLMNSGCVDGMQFMF